MRKSNIHSVIKGTAGCRIDSGLHVAATDIVLVKKRYSAFYGTDLDQVLARISPDGLILAGINTHACIRMTAIDAYQRDSPVLLALDCVDSYDRAHHQVTLDYMRDKLASIRTNSEIEGMIAAAQS